MYNTRYLPENFEQCRLEKTILQHFPYILNVRSRCMPSFKMAVKNHEKVYLQLSKIAKQFHQQESDSNEAHSTFSDRFLS